MKQMNTREKGKDQKNKIGNKEETLMNMLKRMNELKANMKELLNN